MNRLNKVGKVIFCVMFGVGIFGMISVNEEYNHWILHLMVFFSLFVIGFIGIVILENISKFKQILLSFASVFMYLYYKIFRRNTRTYRQISRKFDDKPSCKKVFQFVMKSVEV